MTESNLDAVGRRTPPTCSLPSHFRGPFKYHPSAGCIFDGNGTHVLDVRGWGYLTGRGEGGLRILEGPAAIIQDQFGDWVAAALTAACAENVKEHQPRYGAGAKERKTQ